ncbi:MAG: chalcone isomerase family protein [Acidobacteriota bacterium]|nr:hypothetical protein [Acidobacteriota bacterium]MEC7767909.1 chalcone isomerase family protein [Acidobacteriota bacterium]
MAVCYDVREFLGHANVTATSRYLQTTPVRLVEAMMTRSLRVLILLVTVSASAVAQSTTPDTVHEPRSGTPFPVSLTPPGGTTPHWIMGTAIRQRTIFRVKIYAFGLYVNPEGARASLSPFTGVALSILERNASFYRQLLDLDFAMTLRLVMLRTVSGDDVAEAFDDVLRPRMTRPLTDTNTPDESVALERFRGYFDVDEVRKGTEIVFSCVPAGRLVALVGGDERPPIDSRTLCRALFDVYLGDDPISGEGKRSVIAGFPALLVAAEESQSPLGDANREP